MEELDCISKGCHRCVWYCKNKLWKDKQYGGMKIKGSWLMEKRVWKEKLNLPEISDECATKGVEYKKVMHMNERKVRILDKG